MISNKHKRIVGFQFIAATVLFIIAGQLPEPLNQILRFIICIYIGAVAGYNFKLRQDSADDKINFRYAAILFLVIGTATFLLIKFG